MNEMTQHPQETFGKVVKVEIAGSDLVFSKYLVPDETPTGRQIAVISGLGDPVELIVLHWQFDGVIDEVGLDETVSLSEVRKDRFIVVRSDRSYRFELNGLRNEWATPVVTGATLKRLADAGQDVDVFQQRTAEADLELQDEDHVRLDDEGVEKFYTKKSKLLTIRVNNNPVSIPKGRYTGMQIKQAAIAQNIQIQADFLLSLIKEQGGEEMIGDNDTIKLKDGMEFTAVADDDASME